MRSRKKRGLILVYTGNGKGKTTAALGLAFRAAGHGCQVLILQFMKKRSGIGEMKALDRANLPITMKQFGRRVFFKTRTCEPMDIHMAHLGLRCFQKAMESGAYDLIILDEINMALHFGLIKTNEVLDLLEKKPHGLHLVLTGRKAKRPILAVADLITEMKEIKHPFNQGIKAQRGIEF